MKVQGAKQLTWKVQFISMTLRSAGIEHKFTIGPTL